MLKFGKISKLTNKTHIILALVLCRLNRHLC
uniref:Uncharacterized protein n=1 Tax=Myoviridae sp. ctsIb3 TaxID=2825189 RepID=A0A8S5URF1_9CAUD|nr:MAG TPA: hypothetical protein [Myoviridae sp. ctsIb3]